MTTCRWTIERALRAVRAVAPGESGHVDQLTTGLVALQDLVLELHEARGPLVDVDVTGPWIANENQRCRVQAGSTVVVTLPNSGPVFQAWAPYDYGFVPTPAWCVPGSTGAADNVSFHQPTDGARIEIVGTTQQLFFYRADVNQWVSAYDLRLDDETPLNQRYAGSFATLVAERIAEELALNEPTPGFLRRVSGARATLFTRPGTRREPVRAQYF